MADSQPPRPSSRGSQKRTRSQASNDVRIPSFPSDRSTTTSSSTSTETSLQPQQQASQIEKSVTHLLVATKQLLETLTQWSRGAATETEVSDVYVRLGYEFNIACRSFISVGIDTTDLGPVPDTLRAILEDTLAQEASQPSLDRYLPRIRDIIINLLHGLKRKQQKLRAKTGRDGATAGMPARQGSVASTAASVAGDDDNTTSSRQSSRASYLTQRGDSRQSQHAPQLPPVETSTTNGRTSPAKEPDFSVLNRQSSSSSTTTTTTTRTQQPALPAQQQQQQPNSTQAAPPPPTPPSPPPPPAAAPTSSQAPAPSYPITETDIPPNPDSPIVQNATLKPPGEQDALAALQRGGELERRASRRFSQYQIQKHLGTSSIGMPSMPAQMSPIPNRGRDAQESAQMSRMRSSHMHKRSKSNTNLSGEPSPNRQNSTAANTAKAERAAAQVSADPAKLARAQSTSRSALSPIADSPSKSRMSATITQFTDFETPPSYMPVGESPLRETPPQTPVDKKPEAVDKTDEVAKAQIPPSEPAVVESIVPEPAPLEPEHAEPAPAYEAATAAEQAPSDGPLTLFLQYRKRVKKFVLSDGYSGLSLARLQLAFIEKFAWNTHGNGVDLPDIYLQDAESGVRHELEDLNDVKDYSILVLNLDDLDEVKRHFDDGLGGLKSAMDAVKSAVGDQQLALQRVSDRQQEAAAEMARIAVAPSRSSASAKTLPFQHAATNSPTARGTPSQLQEVQALRRELAVMRQTYSSNVADMEASMSALRAKADAVSKAAVAASSSSMSGDSGRAYVDRSKNQLSEDSEKIINRVDDLQDIVEELRKDVVTRGVRPLPRQLESVSRDVQQATAELRKLRELIRREKPIWTKVGENELKAVCDDQNVLTLQEELAADLEDDLDKAAQTFALVEQATKEQNLQQPGPGQGAPRQASRTLLTGGGPVDPLKAKDGVLGEVRALQPNHETRLEAIERAERARQLELESRRDGEFQREIRNYVQQGRLKKSGGIEEAERMRVQKDEEDRRAIWERLGGKSVYQDPDMEAAAEAKRVEAAAAAAAAAQSQQKETNPSLEVPSASSADDASLASPAEEFVEASEAPLVTPNHEGQEPLAA